MKAAVVANGGVEVREVAKPAPTPDQVLVRVRAAGLNRADLLVAAGHMHGPVGGAGTVMGLEFAGDVEAVGSAVKGIKPGDRVMCSGAGAYAEYAVADWGRVAPIPANNMGYVEAATLPVALQTMHNAVVTAGRLRRGESVMIQGASSGVGLMGLQIAKLMGARLVIGTSTNAARRARLGEVGGFKGEFDFDLHAMKRIDYIGVTFRTRSVEEVREINARVRADLWAGVESGSLKLPIDRVFPLEQAADALAHMRANAHFGKIVLTA